MTTASRENPSGRMPEIRRAAQNAQADAVELLRELIRIPSFSGREGNVVRAIEARMRALGYDEAWIDGFGNVIGRIGSGERALALDGHVDTVEIGDPGLWRTDPFSAEVRDGIVWGRGASDQKGGVAAAICAGALARSLGLLRHTTLYVVGSVFEEDCDGLCWSYLVREKILRPDLVVITEPTDLNLYRGQRGRMEIAVTTRGISCHGSAPERGVNAIYRMAPLIRGIEEMAGAAGDTGGAGAAGAGEGVGETGGAGAAAPPGAWLASDPFLGRGSVTISRIRSTSPSLCAVADSCEIYLDRRLTAGETAESALRGVEDLCALFGLDAEVEVPEFREPTHTGLVYPEKKIYPAWVMPEDDPAVRLGLAAREAALGQAGTAGKWVFSTNGVATRGRHGIPTIGFGPGNEIHAHSPADQCRASDLGAAIAFYLTLAALFDSGGVM